MISEHFLRKFFFPRLNVRFLVRVLSMAAIAYIFFGHVCIPTHIKGNSMAPTYPSRGLVFCWAPAYWFSEPQIGDIVIIRMAGKRVMLLKRVVARAGDTVSFRNGVLYVNGQAQKEDYVVHRSRDWHLEKRKVKAGHIYVIGDNRGMPMENHVFGQTPEERVAGAPLW